MTEFEKKLFNDLKAGYTADEIVAEFRSHLDTASKALEAETKATAAQEEQGQAIAELANRMLNQELTADDVAWVMQVYFVKLAEEMGLGECEKLDTELRASIRDLLVEFTDMAKALAACGAKEEAPAAPEAPAVAFEKTGNELLDTQLETISKVVAEIKAAKTKEEKTAIMAKAEAQIEQWQKDNEEGGKKIDPALIEKFQAEFEKLSLEMVKEVM